MNRKFILNLFFAVGINLLIKPFWILGVERGVQNAVGAGEYGFYFSLFNFSFIFNVVLDFGINNYNNTFIARHPQLLGKKFTRLVMLKLILAVAYIMITMGSALFAGYNNAQIQLLTLLCFNQVLSFAITYLRTNISGLHFFMTDSLLSVLDRLLMILFCSLLLWGQIFGPIQLQWFVYAQTISYGITLLVCFFVLQPRLGRLQWKWNRAFAYHLLRKSYPYALLGLLMGFYSRIDGILLERLLPEGKVAAGNYASAYRLFDAANMIAVLFAGLLLPGFSRLLQRKEDPRSLLHLGFVLIITPALILCSACYFYRSEIIFMLNKTANAEIENSLFLLMASFVFTCTVYIYGTFLTARGALKLLNRIALIACITNLVMNILLIPGAGIIGAAITALVTQGVVAVSHYLFAHRITGNKPDLTLLLKLLIFAGIQLVLPLVLQHLNCHFIVKIILQTAAGIAVLLSLGVFKFAHLNKLISSS
jgi:O-antigen/teichoic acid export membrane protein